MLGAMQEDHSERINLPLTPSMYAAIKDRAAKDQMSAVGWIRKCIETGLREESRFSAIEARLTALESAGRHERASSSEHQSAPLKEVPAHTGIARRKGGHSR